MAMPAILTEDWLPGYHQGEARALVEQRNPALGHVLLADRAVAYVQILYRLLRFRRQHELEPLYDDILDAVIPAEQAVDPATPYTADRFRDDMRQLEAWGLVSCRIEKQRLRGYRDQRKAKFRYRLSDECTAFLEWLEERWQEDLEVAGNDTRDLLEEVCGSLRELVRLLHRAETARGDTDDARRVLYQLHKVDDLTYQVNNELGLFNAQMLGFLVGYYEVGEVRQILAELNRYVEQFLVRLHTLRQEIAAHLTALLTPRLQGKIATCLDLMETERRTSPHLFRGRSALNLSPVPERLAAFYGECGGLDRLCSRISQTAIDVWRKLHAHLRELERKSTRLEDLRARMRELAALPDEAVPYRFLRELLAPAQMRSDPRFWDEATLADPPQPRRHSPRSPLPPAFLAAKPRGAGVARSLEEARLQQLGEWIASALLAGGPPPVRLSQGNYATPDDLAQILSLSKAGLLGGGRRLRRIHYALSTTANATALIALDHCQRLGCPDLELTGGADG